MQHNLTQETEFSRSESEIYELFKKYTFEIIHQGYKNFGADIIAVIVQWEMDMKSISQGPFEDFDQEGPPNSKLSKEEISYYSRKFMRDFPFYEGFFVEDRNWDTNNFWGPREDYEQE